MNGVTDGRLQVALNDLFLLGMMLTLAAILTIAMVLQYGGGEIPCPLCLLQRVAMFGVCFGIMLHFRDGYSTRNTGFGVLFAMFLLIVSVRQTLLDITPRPGHAYIGSTVLGLHMPVWSAIIATAILLAFAINLTAFDGERLRSTASSPALRRAGRLAGLYVVALCLINFASVIVQCGAGACHTMGYRMLGG